MDCDKSKIGKIYKGIQMSIANPKVSVLTPIYNTDPEYLREMIESILNQTFSDFEFLILNDSPDNNEIEKIVLEYAKKDKRIKYSKQISCILQVLVKKYRTFWNKIQT